MKFSIKLFASAALLFLGTATYAQKYKTTADTGKLNVEYAKVQNDIADLTVKLASAKADLPDYQTKAGNADATAQTAAITNSNDAAKATSGNLQDSKDAKKSADDAYDKAKDSRSANKNVGKQDEKIRKLIDQLKVKRQRLKDLDIMRNAILAQGPTN